VRFDRRVTSDLVDLSALRAFLVAHAVPGLDEVERLADGSTRHRRFVRPSADTLATLAVTLPPGEVGTPVLVADGPPDAVAAAAALGRRWLGLDADPASGVAALADDPVLGPLVRARPHLRVPGSTDPFETAVLVVFGQHVSLAAGRAFAARLVAAHGTNPDVGCSAGRRGSHLSTQLGEPRAFPAPEVLAALDPVDLQRTVGITGARAKTVVAIARAVTDGAFSLGPAPTSPDLANTRAAMLSLPGVGPWTADLVALRALRDPDVFLPGDLVLRQALGGVTARQAATASEAWRPHRSLAVLHLWTHHAIDPPR
jgi:DNA-3-methyladenine glycosylase II/AraC family transcriptional regulator of adaptative response / DNA-3-methyladenine glycosylase II